MNNGHYRYVYLSKSMGYNYLILSDKGHTVYEFLCNNDQEAMKLATNYCSSWPHIFVKWIGEKDEKSKKTD